MTLDLLPRIPAYFDRLIAAWHRGQTSRCAHLGHWELPTDAPNARATLCDGDHPVDATSLADTDDFRAAQSRMDTELIRIAGLADGQSILDVGCGFGGLLEQVDLQFHAMNLMGINIDARQLDICHRMKSHGDNAFRWQEADACHLPFADASFDRVFCVEAMFHFDSRRRFLHEAARVLKPGGRLVATDITILDGPAGLSVPQTQLKTPPSPVPRFCIDAILSDGYGPWPDPWCDDGDAVRICAEMNFWEIHSIDATANTLPSYRNIVPTAWRTNRDPGDPASRAALMLQWLHVNGYLKYEYLTAVR